MRHLIALLLCCPLVAHAAQIVLPKWPQPAIVWSNSATGAGLAWNTEQVVSVAGWAPPGTIGVHLSGILIITHGTAEQTCDLRVYLRPDGSSNWGDYRLQTIESSAGGEWVKGNNGAAGQWTGPGGQRSNAAVTVPVVNGTFRVLMMPGSSVAWPTGCAYGVSLFPDYWIVGP